MTCSSFQLSYTEKRALKAYYHFSTHIDLREELRVKRIKAQLVASGFLDVFQSSIRTISSNDKFLDWRKGASGSASVTMLWFFF